MDERDWTSLESSFESIIGSGGDEDLTVSLAEHKCLKTGTEKFLNFGVKGELFLD